MMKSALATLLLLLAATGSIAQSDSTAPQRPDKNTSSIEGTVVKDPGDQPLKKAIVEVIPEEEGGANYTAVSDLEGHFIISNVQPGRYRIALAAFVEGLNWANTIFDIRPNGCPYACTSGTGDRNPPRDCQSDVGAGVY